MNNMTMVLSDLPYWVPTLVDMALKEKLSEIPEVFGSGILEPVGSNNGEDYTMDHTWSM